MLISQGIEALPQRLDVGDWLDEDVPNQVGAGAIVYEGLAVVGYGGPDAFGDLDTAVVPGRGTDVLEPDEVPEGWNRDAPLQRRFGDPTGAQGRYRANDLTI